MDIYNISGFFGAFLYLFSYFLLNTDRIDGNGLNYIYINMAAAIFVSISLIEYFNAPSLLIQFSWITLSIVGIYKYKKKEKEK